MGSKSPGPSKEQNELAATQAQAMRDQMAFDKEMFSWYKDQSSRQEALGLQMFDRQMALADKSEARADEQWGLYRDTAGKQIRKFSDEVDAYDSADYRDQLAGRAIADVESAMDTGRQSLGRGLAARGINMGSAAYLSSMADAELTGALTKASAATLAQEAAKREGLQLRAQAAGLGSGAAGLSTSLTGQTAGLMGSAVDASQLGLKTMTTGVGARNQGSQVAMGWGNSANSTFNSIAEQNYRRSQTGFGAGLAKVAGAVGGAVTSKWLGGLI